MLLNKGKLFLNFIQSTSNLACMNLSFEFFVFGGKLVLKNIMKTKTATPKKRGKGKYPVTLAFRTTEFKDHKIRNFCERNNLTMSEFLRELLQTYKLK